jgi:hypothetical protein
VTLIGDGGRFHVEDWWVYWSIRYLDGTRQPERIEWHDGSIDGGALARSIAGGDVAIGFAGGYLDSQLRSFSGTLERVAWRAPSGKETVALWHSMADRTGSPGAR